MHIYPISFFEDRRFRIDPKLCFVLMPFSEPWSKRVHEAIKEIVEGLGYNCRRADDMYGRVILGDVWQSINEAAFVIADLTSDNPNVYYELGLAHAVGKEIIPLLQEGSEIPFDQRPFRILTYEDNLDGRRRLEKELGEWIGSLGYLNSPVLLVKNERVENFNSWRNLGKPVSLRDEDFSELQLPGIDFSDAQLSQSSFADCNLDGAVAPGALLIRANLARATARGADFSRANLSEADLAGCNLSGADLSESIVLRVRLNGVNLTDCNVDGLTIDAQTYSKFEDTFAVASNLEQIVVEK